jgi:hypothetical protein
MEGQNGPCVAGKRSWPKKKDYQAFSGMKCNTQLIPKVRRRLSTSFPKTVHHIAFFTVFPRS